MDNIAHPIICILFLPTLWSARLNRRWRASALSFLLALTQALPGLSKMPKTQGFIHICKVIVLLDRKAPWHSLKTALDQVTDVNARAEASRWPVSDYWLDGHFEEARVAACYWEQMARLALGDKFNDVREFFRKWGPEPSMDRVREEFYELRRSRGDTRSPIEAPATVKEIMALYQSYGIKKFNNYQSAYLTLTILQWTKTQDYEPARQNLTIPAKVIMTMVWTVSYIKFDRHLAASMGMGEATIERMYAFDIAVDELC